MVDRAEAAACEVRAEIDRGNVVEALEFEFVAQNLRGFYEVFGAAVERGHSVRAFALRQKRQFGKYFFFFHIEPYCFAKSSLAEWSSRILF